MGLGLVAGLAWAGYQAGRDKVDRLFEEERLALQADQCIALFDAADLPLRPRPVIRVATLREFQLALAREIAAELRETTSFNPGERSRVAQRCAAPIARSLVGVCLWDNRILLSPDNYRALARLHPEFLTEGHVRLLLLHELSHASDSGRCRLAARRDEMIPAVWRALSEGHAEFLTRRLALRAGLDVEFAQWERSHANRFVYVAGRRFFEVLEAKGIDAQVAFDFPPATEGEILEPERYLAGLSGSLQAERASQK